jgi:hypothetical protein
MMQVAVMCPMRLAFCQKMANLKKAQCFKFCPQTMQNGIERHKILELAFGETTMDRTQNILTGFLTS